MQQKSQSHAFSELNKRTIQRFRLEFIWYCLDIETPKRCQSNPFAECIKPISATSRQQLSYVTQARPLSEHENSLGMYQKRFHQLESIRSQALQQAEARQWMQCKDETPLYPQRPGFG